MKKYSWIVALLLALSLAFLGCPNDGGKEPEPTPPKEDLVITGSDIVLAVAGTAAPVTIDGNKVTISGTGITSSGFYYEVPDNAKDYNEFEVEFTVVEVKEGAFRLMLKSNTAFDNPSNVTDANHLNEFGMDDPKGIGGGVAGATGTTGKWKLSLMQSKKNITFQHQAWIAGGSEVNSTADYTFEVSKITFFGSGEGEPEPEPKPSWVIENPPVTKRAGTSTTVDIDEEDYTVTFTDAGTINYSFAFTDKDGKDITDEDGNGADAYDFVTVFYTSTDVASSGFKQYNTQDDLYSGFKSLAGNGEAEFEFELRYSRDGFSIQRWGNATLGEMTIKVTKLVFTKGERLPVTFRLGATYGGTSTAPVSPAYFVKGTKVGPLPAAPVWAGKLFTGWHKGTTALTPTTDVDASFNRATLTAGWEPEPTVTDYTVTGLDATSFTGSVNGGTATAETDGTGYTFAQTGGYGPYAMFKVTLPNTFAGGEGRLAYFSTLTFTYTAISGDVSEKAVRFIASATAKADISQNDANGGAYCYGTSANSGVLAVNGTKELTISINKGQAFADLDAKEIWIGFYVHAGGTGAVGGASSATTYKITGITFSQD